MELISLPKPGNFTELLQTQPVVLLQIGSARCAPCAAIRHRIDAWGQAQTGIAGYYVPIEDFPALSAQLGVFSVPTLLVYAEGKLALRESGCFSLDHFLADLERLLALCRD